MRKEHLISVLVVLLFLTVGVSAAATTVTVGSKTFTAVGETGNLDIYIDDLPNGLSGFNCTVTISDPNVATIAGITKPSWLNGQWELTIISPGKIL